MESSLVLFDTRFRSAVPRATYGCFILQRLRRTCYRWWRESVGQEIVSGKFMHTVRGGAFLPVLLVVSFSRTT
jgi:hypothetical protein